MLISDHRRREKRTNSLLLENSAFFAFGISNASLICAFSSTVLGMGYKLILLKQKSKTELTQYQILQILSVTLLDKIPVNQLFHDALLQYAKEPNHNQLKLF